MKYVESDFMNGDRDKDAFVDWAFCDFAFSMQTVEEQLKRLVLVVDAVCVDVQRGQNVYNKLFHK